MPRSKSPRRLGRPPRTDAPSGVTSLIDWHEPEANAHVLDWRERAHEFGLVPVEQKSAIEGVIEPADRLLEEEEPEAFEDQPLGHLDREALPAEELEEAPEARLPHEEVDLVRVYLKHIGRQKLLKAAEEQEIGRKIETVRSELLVHVAAIPSARETLLALADAVRRQEAP